MNIADALNVLANNINDKLAAARAYTNQESDALYDAITKLEDRVFGELDKLTAEVQKLKEAKPEVTVEVKDVDDGLLYAWYSGWLDPSKTEEFARIYNKEMAEKITAAGREMIKKQYYPNVEVTEPPKTRFPNSLKDPLYYVVKDFIKDFVPNDAKIMLYAVKFEGKRYTLWDLAISLPIAYFGSTVENHKNTLLREVPVLKFWESASRGNRLTFRFHTDEMKVFLFDKLVKVGI